jgi:Uma2 family endonuclease
MIQGVKHRLDYDDLQHTPADGLRYELIDGELYVTPSPSPRHQWASKKLQRQLEAFFEDGGTGIVWNAPLDVILTHHDVVEPDLIVVLDPSQISGRGIEGPPAIVVEVLSPSSIVTDRTTKARRYASLGVPHFWIVDVDQRELECYRLREGRYELAASARGDQTLDHPDWPDLVVRLGPLWM